MARKSISRLKRILVALFALTLLIANFQASNSVEPTPALTEQEAQTLAYSQMPRADLAGETIYFVMPDRYANGSDSNDNGAGDFYGGLDKANIGYFHGGDLVGLTENIDRIKQMGFTAIWITPVMAQQAVQGSSAAYHGYWGLDFTAVDPHFGDEIDFQNFVDAAHSREMKVFLDVVVNHTADVLNYAEGNGFESLTAKPYKDTLGNTVNLRNLAGLPTCSTAGEQNCFPLMNAASFPKTVAIGENNFLKFPEFLQDPNNYHNRGSISDWSNKEQQDFGDFVGLDDLMTEKPEVIEGLAEAWASWITRFEVDGLRIDTARHVGSKFFKIWTPLVYEKVTEAGLGTPSLFGEFATDDPYKLSEYARDYGLPSVLDFYTNNVILSYANNGESKQLATLFGFDDFYNLGNSPVGNIGNAYSLVTFIGNHDVGRVGGIMSSQMWGQSNAKITSRVILAYQTLLLMRGSSTVYYGDEVGIAGEGGDKAARQDMFPTQVASWRREVRLGMDPIKTGSSLTITQHPIMNAIKSVTALKSANEALTTGAYQYRKTTVKQSTQVNKTCKSEAKTIVTKDKWQLTCFRFNKKKQVWQADYPNQVAAWSRFDTQTNTEYVVYSNTSDGIREVTLTTSTPNTNFAGLLGSSATFKSDATGKLTVKVPARKVAVFKAASAVPEVTTSITAAVAYTSYGKSGSPEVSATLTGTSSNAIATFIYRETPSSEWKVFGADDNRSYRMVIPEWVFGDETTVEIAVIIRTPDGDLAISPALSVNK